jgi:hypothetical protein
MHYSTYSCLTTNQQLIWIYMCVINHILLLTTPKNKEEGNMLSKRFYITG